MAILVTGVPGFIDGWQQDPSYSWMYLWAWSLIGAQALAWVQALLALGMRARSFRRPLPRPVGGLSLDVPEPLVGWLEFFRKRRIEVVDDHLGRPSVRRGVLGQLLDKERERQSRLAERPHPERVPVRGGVPALE